MNELLVQLYNTRENVAANTSIEKTAAAELFEELEKVAAAEGVDLSAFSNEEIAEILTEAAASAEGSELDEEMKQKMAEVDFFGRQFAHAYYDELTKISSVEAGVLPSDSFKKKEASFEDLPEDVQEQLMQAGFERAEQILAYIDGGQVKESSAFEDEQIDELVSAIAAELLDENGYDVDAIAEALQQDSE